MVVSEEISNDWECVVGAENWADRTCQKARLAAWWRSTSGDAADESAAAQTHTVALQINCSILCMIQSIFIINEELFIDNQVLLFV
jgi:hypothetical protein